MRVLLAILCCAALAAADELRIGVYVGPGSDAQDAQALQALLQEAGLSVAPVTTAELGEVDVLVVGGGSGNRLGEGLGEAGGQRVATFVREGGGYLGIGAGAYLGARGYSAETGVLELADARVVDSGGWRGRGTADVELVPLESPLDALPELARYDHGPLFAPAGGHRRVAYTPWASYAHDLPRDGGNGAMPGTHALLGTSYGRGRVVLSGVQPQARPETQGLVAELARWAGGEGQGVSARTPEPPPGAIPVAVFDDVGSIDGCVEAVIQDARADPRLWLRRIDGKDVRAGALEDYAAVVFPGGSATKQSNSLAPEGQERVRAFVRGGGGYLGICAGAYLAASEPTRYGLGITALRCVDTKHWRRIPRDSGGVIVRLLPSAAYRAFEPEVEPPTFLVYANGPLLAPGDYPELPPVTPLLVFESDVHAADAPPGNMPEKVAAAATVYGEGRVVVFSPHPELTRGRGKAVVQALRWTSRAPEPQAQ
ncbi:MAG: BPL-N domain-containing protein [Planctomycetota bacterium]